MATHNFGNINWEELIDEVVKSWVENMYEQKEKCKECGGHVELTQTVHAEDIEVEYYQCQNCGHEITES